MPVVNLTPFPVGAKVEKAGLVGEVVSITEPKFRLVRWKPQPEEYHIDELIPSDESH